MFCSPNRKCTLETAQYSTQVDDSFYKISKYYSITLDDLMDANPDIDPDNLNAGDLLCIPMSLQVIRCPVGSETYTIEPGDTIYKLSQRFKLKIDTLLNANSHMNPDALLPGQIIYIPKPWNKYSNKDYKIDFLYPAKWAKINDLSCEGVNGFFRISAFKSNKVLEEICKEEAFHKLKPYGSHPEIIPTAAAGLEACLVVPSEDQPKEMKRQAAVVMQYPQEIIINGQNHNHIILWADKEHLPEILNSLVITE